jgi:acetylglutamate kinase
MTKDLSKKSLFRLLDGFTSEREIKKYLQRFESDDFRFAVIKVGGAIVTDDLENLTDSISFLHEVGLCPIIIHGCGPKLTSTLNEKNIEFEFIDGIRVTNEDVLDEAIKAFKDTNNLIVNALNKKNVQAIGYADGYFDCELLDKKYGYVGEIKGLNIQEIKNSINNNKIPVIASLGALGSNQIVNINADIAVLELAKIVQPDKVIFLTATGGVLDENNKIISNISIKDDFDNLINKDWLHSGMKLKIEQIKILLENLPSDSSCSITSPIDLPKELFSDSGKGTLVKKGHQIDTFDYVSEDYSNTIKSILENSFNGKVSNQYMNSIHDKKLFISSCKRAIILLDNHKNVPYMDKFAVTPNARGEGLGNSIWKKMIKENSKVFWRSRHGNDINGFYKQISDGFHKTDKWNIFWIGVKNSDEIIECINYADSKEVSISYE